LKKVARFESYRGFLVRKPQPGCEKPLAEHLGEATKIIDMMVDQAPDGLEVLRGSSSYMYDGNWKCRLRTAPTGYHVSSVHWNYVATTSRAHRGIGRIKAADVSKLRKQKGGYYSFENGHLVAWSRWPIQATSAWFTRTFNETQRHACPRQGSMDGRDLRNLCLLPEPLSDDQMSSAARVSRPRR